MKQVMMVGVLADMLASTASPFASQSNIFSLQLSPMHFPPQYTSGPSSVDGKAIDTAAHNILLSEYFEAQPPLMLAELLPFPATKITLHPSSLEPQDFDSQVLFVSVPSFSYLVP